MWASSWNGDFSIRSAYHFAKGLLESTNGCSSNVESNSKLWKKVWRAKGPRVIQYFLWKACENILSTKGNMHNRRVIEDPLCPICKLVLEMVSHVLWTCPAARDVWSKGAT